MLNLIVPFHIFFGGWERGRSSKAIIVDIMANLARGKPSGPCPAEPVCGTENIPRTQTGGVMLLPYPTLTSCGGGLRPRSSTSLWLRAPLLHQALLLANRVPSSLRLFHSHVARRDCEKSHLCARAIAAVPLPRNFRLDGDPDEDG